MAGGELWRTAGKTAVRSNTAKSWILSTEAEVADLRRRTSELKREVEVQKLQVNRLTEERGVGKIRLAMLEKQAMRQDVKYHACLKLMPHWEWSAREADRPNRFPLSTNGRLVDLQATRERLQTDLTQATRSLSSFTDFALKADRELANVTQAYRALSSSTSMPKRASVVTTLRTAHESVANLLDRKLSWIKRRCQALEKLDKLEDELVDVMQGEISRRDRVVRLFDSTLRLTGVDPDYAVRRIDILGGSEKTDYEVDCEIEAAVDDALAAVAERLEAAKLLEGDVATGQAQIKSISARHEDVQAQLRAMHSKETQMENKIRLQDQTYETILSQQLPKGAAFKAVPFRLGALDSSIEQTEASLESARARSVVLNETYECELGFFRTALEEWETAKAQADKSGHVLQDKVSAELMVLAHDVYVERGRICARLAIVTYQALYRLLDCLILTSEHLRIALEHRRQECDRRQGILDYLQEVNASMSQLRATEAVQDEWSDRLDGVQRRLKFARADLNRAEDQIANRTRRLNELERALGSQDSRYASAGAAIDSKITWTRPMPLVDANKARLEAMRIELAPLRADMNNVQQSVTALLARKRRVIDALEATALARDPLEIGNVIQKRDEIIDVSHAVHGQLDKLLTVVGKATRLQQDAAAVLAETVALVNEEMERREVILGRVVQAHEGGLKTEPSKASLVMAPSLNNLILGLGPRAKAQPEKAAESPGADEERAEGADPDEGDQTAPGGGDENEAPDEADAAVEQVTAAAVAAAAAAEAEADVVDAAPAQPAHAQDHLALAHLRNRSDLLAMPGIYHPQAPPPTDELFVKRPDGMPRMVYGARVPSVARPHSPSVSGRTSRNAVHRAASPSMRAASPGPKSPASARRSPAPVLPRISSRTGSRPRTASSGLG